MVKNFSWNAIMSCPARLNKASIGSYLCYQFLPAPCRPDPTKTTAPFYTFPTAHDPQKDFTSNEPRLAQNLYAQLNAVVSRALQSAKGPVGLLLSGGMDSAILLHLLRQNTRRKIHTVSGAYASDRAHLAVCAALAAKYKTLHQEVLITPQALPRLADIYARKPAAPIGDNGLLATHLMLQKFAGRTATVFAGDGADCLFQGLQAHYLDHLDRTGQSRQPPAATASDSIHRHQESGRKTYAGYAHYKYDELFFTDSDAKRYLGFRLDLKEPLTTVMSRLKTTDPVKKTILLDLNFLAANRVDYILTASDPATQMILPYLDPGLIRHVLRIPGTYFIKDQEQKYILKKAFEHALPRGILHQKKRGMSPPFAAWYAANRSFVLNELERTVPLGISPAYIRQLINGLARRHDYAHGMRVWLLLNLSLWHRAASRPS